MMTPSERAIACERLGTKGALRFDTRETMIATWHDQEETIPTESELEAAWTQFAAIRAAAVQEGADYVATIATRIDTVTAGITRLQAGSVTVAVLVPIVIQIATVVLAMLRTERRERLTI